MLMVLIGYLCNIFGHFMTGSLNLILAFFLLQILLTDSVQVMVFLQMKNMIIVNTLWITDLSTWVILMIILAYFLLLSVIFIIVTWRLLACLISMILKGLIPLVLITMLLLHFLLMYLRPLPVRPMQETFEPSFPTSTPLFDSSRCDGSTVFF